MRFAIFALVLLGGCATWTPRPRTIAMRTGIESPLIVRADGTSTLHAAKDVVRVSDHYSACFVTGAGEVECWGVREGGSWNGMASRDPDVGLHDVVDVSINQTNACALVKDGSVFCWGRDGSPQRQTLPAPAREILVSVSGRACVLLLNGNIASVDNWKNGGWKRGDRGGVAHLLACDRTMVCGERDGGGAACAPSWDQPDVRTGVRVGQQRLLQEIARAPKDSRLAMNDIATAFCAYSQTDVHCFDAESGKSASVTGLQGITEVAIGWARFGARSVNVAGCAKTADGAVKCWDLAETSPLLISLH